METYKRGLGVHAWRSQKASPELTLKTTWKQAKQRLVACPSGEQGDSLSREALRPAVSADPPMASSHRSVSVRECDRKQETRPRLGDKREPDREGHAEVLTISSGQCCHWKDSS